MARGDVSDEVLERLAPLRARALAAYGADVAYAEAMAVRASAIKRKRATWTARNRLREAEQYARTACETAYADRPFTCSTLGACGTSTCRFAAPDLSGLEPDLAWTPTAWSSQAARKLRARPNPEATGPAYTVESLAYVLAGVTS